MDAKFANVECAHCGKTSRIRISNYEFQLEEQETKSQGNEYTYIAENLNHKCRNCGQPWKKISLYEYLDPEHITGVGE